MRHPVLILFVILTALLACQRKTYNYVYPTLNDGKYDSEFPYRSCSEQLDEMAESVRKVYSLVDYETYHFNMNDKFSPSDLAGLPLDTLLRRSTHITKKFDAAHGTGTIIHYSDNRIVLITCAHIIYFPDTLYTYYDDNDASTKDYLHSISVKTSNRIFFMGYDHGRDLEILAIDKELDLALIGKKMEGKVENIKPLGYPLGKSKELDWGNFVYIMGYPLGYMMITRGIISKPVNKRDDYFLVDASFNEGFSGGIVMAIKDGVPNFELVGLGRSASATYENYIVPEKKNYELIYNSDIPYDGEMYVEQKKSLNYGVTRAISSHAMVRFYRANRDLLISKGYQLDYFFLSTEERNDTGLE